MFQYLNKTNSNFFCSNFSNFWNSCERCGIGWFERKIKFQIFSIFIFRIMVFLYSNHPNFRWIFMITRKIKIRNWFFIYFTTLCIIYETGSKLRGRNILGNIPNISLVGKSPLADPFTWTKKFGILQYLLLLQSSGSDLNKVIKW